MKILLDTNALLYATLEPSRLPRALAERLDDDTNTIYVSAASGWEIAVKQSIGKLKLPALAQDWLPPEVAASGFEWLSILPEHALAVGTLPWIHRDPFDRILVAQALTIGAPMASSDRLLEGYGVKVLWR